MIGYVQTRHPITGAKIQAVATGKKDGSAAEFLIITPKSNLGKVWLQRGDILEE